MGELIDVHELSNEININPLEVYNKCNNICNNIWNILSNEEKVKILVVKSKTLAMLRYYEEGVKCCKEAYKLAETKKQLCEVYIVHALVESSIDNDLEAGNLYFKALRIAKELDDWKSLRRIYNNVSAIYRMYEDYDEAYKYLLKIQELDNIYGEEIIEGVITLHQGMARIYASKKEYIKALSEVDKAIVYSKKNCHVINEAFGILEKAQILGMADHCEEALVFLRKCKNMFNKVNVHTAKFLIIIEEINCYYKLGQVKLIEKSLLELEEYVKGDKFVDLSKYIEVMLKILPNNIKESSVRIILKDIIDKDYNFKKNKKKFLGSALKQISDNHELKIKNEFLEKQNKELEVEIKKVTGINETVNLISEIGMNIVSLKEEKQIISLLYSKIGLLAKIDAIGLILLEDNSLDKAYFMRDEKIITFKEELKSRDTISSIIVENSLNYFIHNNIDTVWLDVLEEMKSILFIPLICNGKINGLLTLQNKYKNAFDEEELGNIRSLATFIAISINNLRI